MKFFCSDDKRHKTTQKLLEMLASWFLLIFFISCSSSLLWTETFMLTRSTKSLVTQVMKTYTQEQLGLENYEDRSERLEILPELSLDFNSWMKLQDVQRLHTALQDLNVYWTQLELSRTRLEKEEKNTDSSLPENFFNIQLDLRDLMIEVEHQLRLLKSSWIPPSVPTVVSRRDADEWTRRVEGFLVLRDLHWFLVRLARDFLLLEAKANATNTEVPRVVQQRAPLQHEQK